MTTVGHGRVPGDQAAAVSAAANAEALAARGATVFADATEPLGTLREHLSAMGADLKAFAGMSAAGATSIEATRELARRVAAAENCLRAALDEDRALAMRTELEKARHYLHATSRAGRTLSAVATLTRATAGSFGFASLNGYVDELASIASSMRENVEVLRDQLNVVDACRARTGCSASSALQELGSMAKTVRSVDGQAEAHLDRERVAGQAIETEAQMLTARGKSQMKAFIGIVQFSDRLAQRLDHLGAILAHDDAHARRLAAAHVESICVAIRQTADATATAGREIADISRAGGALFLAGEISAAIRDGLAERARAANAIAREIAGVDAALSETRTGVATAAAAMAEARVRFGELELRAKRVANASINSTLMASRAGPARAPLTTLAAEVRLTAVQCLAAIGGCQAAMNRLDGLGLEANEDLVHELDALADALAAYRSEIDAGRERLDALTALSGRAGARVEAMGADVAALDTAAVRMRGVAEALAEVARQIDGDACPDAAPDPALLASVWDLYTMDDERAVHAAVFAEFGAAQPAAGAQEDQTEDILF